MEPEQGKAVTNRHSRPATPTTPPKYTVRPASASIVPHKRAWVAAEWKHRIPDPGLPGPRPAAGGLNSRQRAKMSHNQRQQVAAEYACVHTTINNILARCNQVQQRLGHSNTNTPAGSRPHSPTYISRRSKILFEAPPNPEESAKDATGCNSISRFGSSHGSENPAASLPVQTAPSTSWAGAVDLNPGFSFRPGTPTRLAATCPELPMLLANISSFVDVMKHSDMLRCSRTNGSGSANNSKNGSSNSSSSSYNNSICGMNNLNHREVLQAGLQQLNGEFYAGMLGQTANKSKQGVIPASWKAMSTEG